ncbi:NADH:flavorubredoxin reductase NorW [Photobacterium alginatilyticum]|uniref:NADH:flavorubredoxin reductase NorW n=1 Tax=Photobacterium alginatilyticum TaxID=1775171 RepID=A0ABW9YD04_9GAMM|nr:NADH:flavorubredoxin reductase NorW [Photobacterium alginatilyticum]NBI51448.1 NADH:flavorubredoxin reductase NorW [Photobacterium alginatilyticum]
MDKHIVIIGSGFAAYQLVKSLRKLNTETPVTVITADSGDDYSKPELSHVFSRRQNASDLIKQSAEDFASTHNIELLAYTRVQSIDTEAKTVQLSDKTVSYSELVLATGASSFVPPFDGNATDEIVTLNSLGEYASHQDKIATAKSVIILGAGLIGTEIAMDLAEAGKQVTICDRASSLMPTLLPSFMGAEVFQTMTEKGVDVKLSATVTGVNRHHQQLLVQIDDKNIVEADVVIAAMGLKPSTVLAEQANITVNRGIVIDEFLKTSADSVYALGDCAELGGKIRAFLQPTMLSAMALAKTLSGNPTPVKLPASLVKAKTPWFPLNLSGQTARSDVSWEITRDNDGYIAKAFEKGTEKLVGFVVSHEQQKAAFPLLRQLPAE